MAKGTRGKGRLIILFLVALAVMLGGLSEVRAAVYEAVSGVFWSGTGAYAARTRITGGDVNGDGFGDVIQLYRRTTTSSSVYVFRSGGASMTRSSAKTFSMEFTKTQIAAGDYDGDGRDDLYLLHDRGGSTCSLYVMVSSGTALGSPRELYRSSTGGMAFSRARLASSDANKDGKDEGVIFYESGSGRAKMFVLGKANITGVVRQATDGAPMSGVAVTLYSGTTQVGQTTTGADGSFAMAAWGGSSQKAVFSKSGYVSADYWGITPRNIGTTALETVRMVPSDPSSAGSVAGMISNAFNGTAVSGVSVRLRLGVNNRAGALTAYSAVTVAGGTYSFASLPRGLYTAQLSRTGYTTTFFTIVCVGGQNNPDQNMSISPNQIGSDSADIRAVLTWDQTPADLDSHLTGPVSGGGRFHVYYLTGYRQYPSGSASPYAILDHDDTNSYGPETITISRTSGGVYRYSVHDYTNKDSGTSTALAGSGARVNVYKGSSLIGTYYVPNSAGTLWTVFEVTDSNFTSVNSMSYQGPSSTVQ